MILSVNCRRDNAAARSVVQSQWEQQSACRARIGDHSALHAAGGQRAAMGAAFVDQGTARLVVTDISASKVTIAVTAPNVKPMTRRPATSAISVLLRQVLGCGENCDFEMWFPHRSCESIARGQVTFGLELVGEKERRRTKPLRRNQGRPGAVARMRVQCRGGYAAATSARKRSTSSRNALA